MPIDKKTIEEAQNGIIPAQQKLIGICGPWVDSECNKFGLSKYPDLTVSDLTQEVKIHLLRKLGGFSGENSKNLDLAFRSWVRKLTRNFLISFVKRRRGPIGKSKDFEAIRESDLEDEKNKPIDIKLQKEEDTDKIALAMKNILDEPTRVILIEKIYGGAKFVELAEKLDMSVDQVRYRYKQGLTKLKSQLES